VHIYQRSKTNRLFLTQNAKLQTPNSKLQTPNSKLSYKPAKLFYFFKTILKVVPLPGSELFTAMLPL
jgi:hypothetical protein